nr:hypothetical protein [Deltaproteobacteria bacterium]
DYFGSILTFDIVDKLPVMSCASNYHLLGDPDAQDANVAGIHIGLPTLELFVDEIVLESITMSSDDLTPYNMDKSIGRLTAEDVQFDLLGGSFEVAPYQGGGIETSLDDVILFGKAGGLTYFDVDEGGTENSIRSFRIMDLLIDVIRINALTHLDGYGQPQSSGNGLFLTAGTDPGVCNVRQADNYDFTAGNWENRFFSLDMTNALPAMSALAGSGSVAGVYLGIPAMELFMDHMEFVCTAGNDDDELLGKLRLEGLDFVTLEGSLEIAPHSQYGIDIAMDDAVIYLSFDQFAYQDLDDHGEFCINNLEFDTLNINAITLDTLGNVTSPGMHGLHLAHLNPAYAPSDFSPSPVGIDLCGNLPKMSLEVGHPMAGMSIDLPTMEIYSTEIGIGSVSLHDPDNTAVNNDAPFFQGIRFQDAVHAFLGGRMEIAPH